MQKSRFSETQIVSILKQGDAGMSVKVYAANMASARRPITSGKSKYGGMEASDLKRIKAGGGECQAQAHVCRSGA
jgi:putative transposase